MHEQVAMKVTAFVDKGIAPLVEALNDIPGVVTMESCQGGGPHEAWVCFEYGAAPADYRELAAILAKVAFALVAGGLAGNYMLRMEWAGNNDFPNAHLYVNTGKIETAVGLIRKMTATRNHKWRSIGDT